MGTIAQKEAATESFMSRLIGNIARFLIEKKKSVLHCRSLNYVVCSVAIQSPAQ